MRFSELHVKGARAGWRGDFSIVQVNGVTLFVGDQDPDNIGDGQPTSLKGPKAPRIAVPVGSVEYAVPAEDEDEKAGEGARIKALEQTLEIAADHMTSLAEHVPSAADSNALVQRAAQCRRVVRDRDFVLVETGGA